MHQTETSPLKDNKYEHFNKGSTLSGTISDLGGGVNQLKFQMLTESNKPALIEFVKKQKRERSKKRKVEEYNDFKTINKKEKALKNLQQ